MPELREPRRIEDMPQFIRGRNPLKRMMNGRRNLKMVIDTVGLEFESTALFREDAIAAINELPVEYKDTYNVDRDGSIELKTYLREVSGKRNTLRISSHTIEAETLFEGGRGVKVSGVEIISEPMQISDAKRSISLLIPLLNNKGNFFSERCATHIHVGMSKNLDICKSALALGLYIDEFMFSIAGLRRKFRGESNHSIYARPLESGPFGRYGSDAYQILNPESAFSARNLYEFFYSYHLDIDNNIPRYHPGRYFSLNLYSILLHETLEFRYFNQSDRAKDIIATTELCQLVSELVFKGNWKEFLNLGQGSPFKEKPKGHYESILHTINALSRKYNCKYSLQSSTVDTLLEILYTTPFPKLNDENVFTHVKDWGIDLEMASKGRLKRASKKPVNPGNVDIHNIGIYSIL